MSSERLNYNYDHEDDYPEHWPGTSQFLRDAEERLYHFDEMVEQEHWDRKMTAFFGEQAAENAIKAWLSHHQDEGIYRHDLEGAWAMLQQKETKWQIESGTPDRELREAREAMQAIGDLMEHTRYEYPDREGRLHDGNRLAPYGAAYRYSTPSCSMSREEERALRDLIDPAVNKVKKIICRRNNTTDADIWLGGIKPWEL